MKKFNFGFTPKPLMRLQRIEEILRQEEIFDPIPSRPTLIALIEQGTLEGVKTRGCWLVSRHSFVAWVKSFQPQYQHQLTSNTKAKLRLASSR